MWRKPLDILLSTALFQAWIFSYLHYYKVNHIIKKFLTFGTEPGSSSFILTLLSATHTVKCYSVS